MPERLRRVSIESPEAKANLEKAVEHFKEHFALRMEFAKRMSQETKEPLWLCLRRYTDLYDMLGLGGPERHISDEIRKRRQVYEWRVEGADNEEEALRVSEELYRAALPSGDTFTEQWHPFKYTYDKASGTVSTHFIGALNPLFYEEKSSALSSAQLHESRQKVKEMFQTIREEHPDAEYVEGCSWLYNLEAYRRLYPEAYLRSAELWNPHDRQVSTPMIWAQFYSKDGGLNLERVAQFREKMKHLDPEHPEDAFPYRPVIAGCDIGEFYKEYGIG
jgi:hypothetical protein